MSKMTVLKAVAVITLSLACSACSINFGALLQPFASDAEACDKLSRILEQSSSESGFSGVLEKIEAEVLPLAEPELSESLQQLIKSASSLESQDSIFETLGGYVVAAQEAEKVITRCVEVGVEVQYQ